MPLTMRSEESHLLSEYLENLLQPQVRKLAPWEQKARENSQLLNLGGISLSRGEALLLRWAVQQKPTMKAVEIGTLTGLSGLYILDGLQPGGTLWTLEKNPEHARMATEVLKSFAKDQNKKAEVVVGDARETLQQLEASGPFDFVFVDGNKAAYCDYLDWAEKNLRTGGVLVGDNVLLGGEIGQTEGKIFSKKQIQVMRIFNDRLLNAGKWKSTLIPTSEGLLVSEKL